MRTILTALYGSMVAFVTMAQDTNTNAFIINAPTADLVIKKTLQHMLDGEIATASANYAAACITVTHAVRRKCLLVFAVEPTAKTGVFKERDLEVEVVFSHDLSKNDAKAAGAYHQHNNSVVLSYAAWRYASGDRDFGLSLMKRLADAHPTLGWSSPSHLPITIKQIVSGLEKNDGSMDQYVKEDSEWWLARQREFGK